MDKGKRKEKKKNKSAADGSETVATSATNTKEVKKDGTKVGQTFSKKIQAPKNVHHFVTKLPADNQVLRSTEDVNVGEKSSHIQVSFKTDEETEELFKGIEKTVTFYKSMYPYTPLGARRASSAQYQDRTNSILDGDPNLSLFLKLCHREFFKNAVRLISLNEKNVDRLWNIFYSSCEVSETAKKSKKFHVMKVIKVVNETQIPNEVEIFDTFFLKNDSSSVDDKKASKEIENINDLIMQLKQIAVNKKQNDAKSLEDKEALKKVDYLTEDLIVKLKESAEYRKEKECSSSTDNKEAAGKFPLTTTEEKKKEIGKEDLERSNEGIQDSRLNKGIILHKHEIEYGIRKNYMDETICPEKTKILPAGDFNPHKEGEKRNFFSLGTEPITATAKTESHEKTKDTTDIKYDLQELVVPEASYEPKEVVIDLKQTEDFHFHFDTDNNMNILVGDKDYQLKGDQVITFSCKEENVTISFTGKQISVSTPSSEFDISVRKSDHVDLTDKATKTDDLM